jgi:outer membrane protein OmpA-like peptidoglycan-associated protein
MPIFYNTAAPTPTTKNTINSVTVGYGIRDFLLNLNLLPTSMVPAGYSTNTAINGSPRVGEPVLNLMVNSGANVVPNGLPLETEGILWKELIIVTNKFKNTDSTANNLKSVDYVQDISNTDFGNAEWPQGIQPYPTFENADVEAYGIKGKTAVAEYRKKNTIKNLYLDASKQIDMASFIDLQPLDISQQIKGYLDTYGGLNLGGSGGVQAANVIGSIVNGQGLGLAKGGVVTNFDVRSSLAGRVLGATGLINDTKLGLIGGQQLALALANNAAFNLQQDILGALNIQDNILSLVKGDGFAAFPRPNYTITIPEGKTGRILDYTSKVLGFTIPRSYVTDDGSLFQSESGADTSNVDRANALILTTGKGQIQALLTNVKANQIGTSAEGYDSPKNSPFRVGYAPAYANNKGEVQITDGIIYAFYKDGKTLNLFNKEDGVISDLTYLREDKVDGYGFQSPDDFFLETYQGNGVSDENNIKTPTFSWSTTKEGLTNTEYGATFTAKVIPQSEETKKSLLVKTQKLFNSKGMKNIVSRKGEMSKFSTQIQTANGYGFSKGNAVLSKASFNLGTGRVESSFKEPEDAYCRAWTTYSRYDTIAGGPNEDRAGLVRNDALYLGTGENSVPFRNIVQNSVLEDTGFVKIVPYRTDFDKAKDAISVDSKRYMLSIENLAWHDKRDMLPKGELGPGDLITGKKGRIMWFPPYDIQFSESTSVEWETNKFIGRGEPIYTYNNTERTGNLSFKIIVDHSTYTNTFRDPNGPDDHYVASFMAGCIEPSSIWTDKFTSSQSSQIVSKENRIPQKKQDPKEPPMPEVMFVYFANDNTILIKGYENGLSGSTSADTINYEVNPSGDGFGIGAYPAGLTKEYYDKKIPNSATSTWPDTNNYGLNYSKNSKLTKESKVGDAVFRGIYSPGYFDSLAQYLKTECKFCNATVSGYASGQGTAEVNEKLSKLRADAIIEFYIKELVARGVDSEANLTKRFKVGKFMELGAVGSAYNVVYEGKKYPVKKADSGCIICVNKDKKTVKVRNIICPVDQLGCKQDRKAEIVWAFDKDAALAAVEQPADKIEITNETITTTIKQKFYNETMFFDKLLKTDSFIFDKFREKIKYFHPAFHSTTPEGLNSRLTFLQQCTRQGSTDNKNTNNLAFGRPPVCILRIGDFYHTKIVMDSVSFEYEPLVWDLNPEGIGVQPMIANVSISFKFLGGESMYGPLNKLQNALSFNYFANTQVYEARADYISQERQTNTTVSVTDTPGKKAEDGSSERYDVTVTAQRISPTGFYYNNGRESIDPEISTVSTTVAPVASPDNQIKGNENANSGTANQTEPATTGTTEPKLTGIKFISVNESQTLLNSTGIKNSILLKMNSENIITGGFIVENIVKPYVEKGIKITLKGIDLPSLTTGLIKNDFYYEEIVKFEDDGDTYKGISALVSNGYKIGKSDTDDTLLDIPNGYYTLSVLEQTNIVAKAVIIVGKTDGYIYPLPTPLSI